MSCSACLTSPAVAGLATGSTAAAVCTGAAEGGATALAPPETPFAEFHCAGGTVLPIVEICMIIPPM
jgi:hypothetical protein